MALSKQLSISEDENGARTLRYLEYDEKGTNITDKSKPISNEGDSLSVMFDTATPPPTEEAAGEAGATMKTTDLPETSDEDAEKAEEEGEAETTDESVAKKSRKRK